MLKPSPKLDPATEAIVRRMLATPPQPTRAVKKKATKKRTMRGPTGPHGTPATATPAWIAANVHEILATLQRLYGLASCLPTAHEFLDRMAWLMPLLVQFDRTRGQTLTL